jgi:hypothetical protein
MQRFEVRKQSGKDYEVWDNGLRKQQAGGVSKRQAEKLAEQGNHKANPIPKPSVIQAQARRIPIRKAIGR